VVVADHVNTRKPSKRDERARVTRNRILDAAREEFLSNGFHATQMQAIADRAGVSVQMLYFAFGKKGHLMAAVVERAVVGEDAIPPEQAEWFANLALAPSARETLRRFIVGSSEIYRRAGPVDLVARTGAATEEILAQSTMQGAELRAAVFGKVVELAAANGPLRLDLRTAKDVLIAAFSPALYMEFINDRGWSHEQAMTWLADNIPALIAAD